MIRTPTIAYRLRGIGGLSLLLFAVTASIVLSTTPAAAHARLIGSDPEDGATVDVAPVEIVLEFSERVQEDFAQVAVLDADDGHHEDGEPVVSGSTVTQAVNALSAGDYRISYRVGSSDGHPISGTLTFTVTAREDAEPVASPEPTHTAPASPPAQTQSPEPTEPAETPSPTEVPPATATPVAGPEDSDSALRWLGAGAAVAAAAALLFGLLRRPGGGSEPTESDTSPQ